MIHRYVLLTLLLLVTVVGIGHAETRLAPDQRTSDLRSHWIDVRTPAEFAGGHITNARNIEFQNIAAEINEVTTDKNANIKLYCKSGRRSSVARETLLKLGYQNAENVGSYTAALASFAAAADSSKE